MHLVTSQTVAWHDLSHYPRFHIFTYVHPVASNMQCRTSQNTSVEVISLILAKCDGYGHQGLLLRQEVRRHAALCTLLYD